MAFHTVLKGNLLDFIIYDHSWTFLRRRFASVAVVKRFIIELYLKSNGYFLLNAMLLDTRIWKVDPTNIAGRVGSAFDLSQITVDNKKLSLRQRLSNHIKDKNHCPFSETV